MGLSDIDRAMLDVAADPPRKPGALDERLVAASGLPIWRAWQRINKLLGEAAAWEYAPLTCKRLEQRRDRMRIRRRTTSEA